MLTCVLPTLSQNPTCSGADSSVLLAPSTPTRAKSRTAPVGGPGGCGPDFLVFLLLGDREFVVVDGGEINFFGELEG